MERILTKTLARIYIQQGHFLKAYEIYKTLAEKDPSDMEIQRKVNELREKLHPSPPFHFPHLSSREDRIRHLEKWLANIRKQKGS